MAYYNTGLNASATGIAGAGSWIAFHTADPAGVAGANQSGVRTQTTWGTAAAGLVTGSQVNPSISAGVTLNYWSINSSQSGTTAGTMVGSWPLDAPVVFSSAGTMPFTPVIEASN